MQTDTPRTRSWLRRTLICLLGLLLLAAAALAGRCLYAFRDRNPGYTVALDITGAAARGNPRPLRVGFGRATINPDFSNAGRKVWVAGFSQHRAATGIHDDLRAVACVIDDGYTRLGIVVLDAIGLFHDDVIQIRRELSPEWKINYAVVCTTHNHSTPDLMGLWGPDVLHTGVDPRYRAQVLAAASKAMGDAVAALEPALVAFHEIPTSPAGLVTDTRKPEVFDPDIRVMHFTRPATGATIGSLVGWADHPETPWGQNTELTADFPGYLRDALERGIQVDGRVVEPGLGGIHVYVNGAIGGLMTTSPTVTVRDPYLERDFKEPSHDKARALGRQLASRILPRLRDKATATESQPVLGVRARTIEVPLENFGFLAAPVLGLIDRGHVRWKTLRTEVALATFGDATIACVPGEIYPELVNGGIENPPGADFAIAPVEVPPIREMMPGRVKFIFGLANDEIGYIIPKSEWDQKPPYLYHSPHRLYGEVNSVGPDAAEAIHAALKALK